MNTKLIAVTTKDGRLLIMEFVLEVRMPPKGLLVRGATAKNVEAEIKKAGIDAASWRFVSRDQLPDRTFRDAWVDDGKAVDVDLPRARDIKMKSIRQARDKKLQELDVEAVRAIGKKDEQRLADIEAAKEILRDLPATFDLEAAGNAEALALMWPKELE